MEHSFRKEFLQIKYIIVIISIFIILLEPKTVPFVLAANIFIATTESVYKKDLLSVLLGTLLVLWSLLLKYNDHCIIEYLIVYTFWNAWFFYSGYHHSIESIAQVLIPTLIAFILLLNIPDKALFYFALIRGIVLFSILTYKFLPI